MANTTFFSYNGGSTRSSLSFNNEYALSGVQVNSGDTADFVQQDVFGTGNPGETTTLSQTDIQVMEALGWSRAGPRAGGLCFERHVERWVRPPSQLRLCSQLMIRTEISSLAMPSKIRDLVILSSAG